MKMKKNFKFYAIIWAVFLALFNALVFLIRPFMPWFEGFSDPQFWIAWAFILVSFIANLLCAYKAFREENLEKLFYRLPLITVSYTCLIVMLVLGSVLLMIPFSSVWITVVVCVVITAISAVAVLRADWAGEVVNATHEKVKTQTQFIKLLTVDAETLMNKANTPESKIAAKKVYEAVRYSDPMSNPALGGVEAELAEKYNVFKSAVVYNTGVDQAADSLLETLDERNKKCRALK